MRDDAASGAGQMSIGDETVPDRREDAGRSAPRAPHIPAGRRIYAIGDIHGRLDLLEQLVAMIREDNDGRPAAIVSVILLGDVIDRGPSSAMLVDRCRALVRRHDRFIVLRGNHEAMMVHSVRGNVLALALWMRNGGDAALRSWGVPEAMLADGPSAPLLDTARDTVPAATITWLDALPLVHGCGDYLFVHAGIRPGVALDSQATEDLLWIRDEFLSHPDGHERMVVHGHSIEAAGVAFRPNRIGIDTGAYRTGVLTALGLERDERWTLATAGTKPAAAPLGQLERHLAAILDIPEKRLRDARRGRSRIVTRSLGMAAAVAAIAVAATLWDRTAPSGTARLTATANPQRIAAASDAVRLSPSGAAAIGPIAGSGDDDARTSAADAKRRRSSASSSTPRSSLATRDRVSGKIVLHPRSITPPMSPSGAGVLSALTSIAPAGTSSAHVATASPEASAKSAASGTTTSTDLPSRDDAVGVYSSAGSALPRPPSTAADIVEKPTRRAAQAVASNNGASARVDVKRTESLDAIRLLRRQ